MLSWARRRPPWHFRQDLRCSGRRGRGLMGMESQEEGDDSTATTYYNGMGRSLVDRWAAVFTVGIFTVWHLSKGTGNKMICFHPARYKLLPHSLLVSVGLVYRFYHSFKRKVYFFSLNF